MVQRIRRALGRVVSRAQVVSRRPERFVESLENRQFLNALPIVTGIIADNRGEVQITLNRYVRGVSKQSVKLFTSGNDGVIGTADDVNINTARVSFNEAARRITIKADTDVNASYRVKLESNLLVTPQGVRLDGEFTGTTPSGNGRQGGTFNFVARRDRSATPLVRMTTTEGVITLRLRRDVAAIHASNFQTYMNSGRYDNIFFTRSENNPQPFVIQGGALQIIDDGLQPSDVIAPNRDPAIDDQNDRPDALSNILGTMSFAKGGPDSATNQFFINLADNSFLDSPARPDGGFTVFAEVVGGLNVAQAINQKPVANLSSQIGTVASSAFASVNNVPVQNTAQAEAGLVPFRDLPYIRRIAQRMKVGALI